MNTQTDIREYEYKYEYSSHTATVGHEDPRSRSGGPLNTWVLVQVARIVATAVTLLALAVVLLRLLQGVRVGGHSRGKPPRMTYRAAKP